MCISNNSHANPVHFCMILGPKGVMFIGTFSMSQHQHGVHILQMRRKLNSNLIRPQLMGCFSCILWIRLEFSSTYTWLQIMVLGMYLRCAHPSNKLVATFKCTSATLKLKIPNSNINTYDGLELYHRSLSWVDYCNLCIYLKHFWGAILTLEQHQKW